MSYFTMIEKSANQQVEDIITLEELKYDISSNPRSIITVRKCNGDLQCYPIGVLQKLMKTTNSDPLTREQFTSLARKRIRLYIKGVLAFPDHTRENLDTVRLFNEWKNTFNPECDLTKQEKYFKRLEAKCYLLAEDLVDFFYNFGGEGCMKNRNLATKLIQSRKVLWLLRTSSIKSTKHNKIYVLSFVNIYADSGISHVLILHRFGEGFYYDLGAGRGTTADNINTVGSKKYPTIISLLEKHVFKHERSKTVVRFD